MFQMLRSPLSATFLKGSFGLVSVVALIWALQSDVQSPSFLRAQVNDTFGTNTRYVAWDSAGYTSGHAGFAWGGYSITPTDTKVFHIGGRDFGQYTTARSDVLVSTNAKQWTKAGDFPVPISDHTAVWFQNKLWVFGGQAGDPASLSALAYSSPTGSSWQREPAYDLPAAQKLPLVHVLQNKLWLVTKTKTYYHDGTQWAIAANKSFNFDVTSANSVVSNDRIMVFGSGPIYVWNGSAWTNTGPRQTDGSDPRSWLSPLDYGQYLWFIESKQGKASISPNGASWANVIALTHLNEINAKVAFSFKGKMWAIGDRDDAGARFSENKVFSASFCDAGDQQCLDQKTDCKSLYGNSYTCYTSQGFFAAGSPRPLYYVECGYSTGNNGTICAPTVAPRSSSSSSSSSSSAITVNDLILDDADAGFISHTGTWSTDTSSGFRGGQHIHATGPQSPTTPLEWGGWGTRINQPGSYKIYVTWEPSSSYSNKVTYKVDRSMGLISLPSENNGWTRLEVNQKQAPTASFTCNGRNWKLIGNITITSDYRYVGIFAYAENTAPRNAKFAIDAAMIVSAGQQPTCVVVTPTCGDGAKEGTEACDNGAQNGQVCTPVYGGSCTYCSSTCTNITLQGESCGDGTRNGNEQCDGTTAGCTSGQTCNASCRCVTVVVASSSSSSSSSAGPTCGNGTKNTGEQCDSAARSHATGVAPNQVVTADINRDGKMDVVSLNMGITEGSLSVFLGDGTGVLSAAISTPLPYLACYPMKVADFDADSVLDVLVQCGTPLILKGNGNGTFQEAVTAGLPLALFALVGDFNHDDDPDVFIPDAGAGVYLGGAGMTFQKLQDASEGAYSHCEYEWNEAADYDGDGKLDVACVGRDQSGMSVQYFFGDGQGGLSAPVIFRTNYDGNLMSVHAGDVDRDGDADLVLNHNGPGIRTVISESNRTFREVPNININVFYGAALADIDGDTYLDLVAATGIPQLNVYKGQGDGNFASSVMFTVPFTYRTSYGVAVADFDGNGAKDFVVTHGGALGNSAGNVDKISVSVNHCANGQTCTSCTCVGGTVSSSSSAAASLANLAVIHVRQGVSAGNNTILPGQTNVDYSIYVGNTGPSVAPQVVLTVTAPAGFVFDPSHSSNICVLSGSVVRCTRTNVPNQDYMNYDIRFTLPSPLPACGTTLQTTATVSGSGFTDNFPSDNQASHTATVWCVSSSSSRSSSSSSFSTGSASSSSSCSSSSSAPITYSSSSRSSSSSLPTTSSSSSSQAPAVCGNGSLEFGEGCERGVCCTSGYSCDTRTCQCTLLGAVPTQSATCGNYRIEGGEDCEDGLTTAQVPCSGSAVCDTQTCRCPTGTARCPRWRSTP
ncbi:MAG: FG-GAP-like repeat-containing protein [Candidatus Peregrinibacteria bacterium]